MVDGLVKCVCFMWLCGCVGDTSICGLFIQAYMFWMEVAQFMNIQSLQDFPDLLTNLWHWHSRECGFYDLHVFFCWSLWKMRNNVIFDNIKPYSTQVCVSFITMLKDFPPWPLLHSKHEIVGDPTRIKYHVGFFDGVLAGGTCGGGIYLCIRASHLFHFNMGCGMGSNTSAELLELW